MAYALTAVVIVCGAHATSHHGAVADAKKRTGKRYCTPRSHPHGCIKPRYCTTRSHAPGCRKVPPSAFRDTGVDPQDPPEVVVGGVGGGIG